MTWVVIVTRTLSQSGDKSKENVMCLVAVAVKIRMKAVFYLSTLKSCREK